MHNVFLYIEMCSGSQCANCVRFKYVEALRIAHRQIQEQRLPYNKKNLEEYALNAVDHKLRCFGCVNDLKELQEKK